MGPGELSERSLGVCPVEIGQTPRAKERKRGVSLVMGLQVGHRVQYPAIGAELLEMSRVDQAMRNEANSDLGKWNADVDRRNTARLQEIIGEIGWPTRSKVGSEASAAAWLLAQHSDLDLPFQVRALSLMKECSPTEVDPHNIAYLEDRVCVAQGRLQIFGTQFRVVDGAIKPFPIENESRVDQRRAAIGLPSLAQYLDGFRCEKG